MGEDRLQERDVRVAAGGDAEAAAGEAITIAWSRRMASVRPLAGSSTSGRAIGIVIGCVIGTRLRERAGGSGVVRQR